MVGGHETSGSGRVTQWACSGLLGVRLVVRVTWWACMGRDGGTCGVVGVPVGVDVMYKA